ncbi:hypothetical protein [Millisia brevis]|uniref:hypothetical protein n=1 Tax=Millisia brevis TaxID=264148 RepID=UPI000A0018D0|nr:hypothetical protein [Millisia brevis]
MTNTLDQIGPEQNLTAEEGIELGQRVVAANYRPQWRWMGNYGSVHDVARVANSVGCGAGALITVPNPSGSGLLPTYMYY